VSSVFTTAAPGSRSGTTVSTTPYSMATAEAAIWPSSLNHAGSSATSSTIPSATTSEAPRTTPLSCMENWKLAITVTAKAK
jgi:hypothetical protein